MKKLKNIIKYSILLIIGVTGLLCVGHCQSQFANIAINEVYFDGTDEWIQLINHGDNDFSGQITISGAASQNIYANITIGAKDSILLCDQCGMIQKNITKILGLGISLSDTSQRSIGLLYRGNKISEFAPGELTIKLNDKKQSIIKTLTGYAGAIGSGCNSGYSCALTNSNTSNNVLIISEIYGGDECVGEYIKINALTNFSGDIGINNQIWRNIIIGSGESIFLSNSFGWTTDYVYGYSGNIVQSKGGKITLKINTKLYEYNYNEILTGMIKISGTGEDITQLFDEKTIEIDASCSTIQLEESTQCGIVNISGGYHGNVRNYSNDIQSNDCKNIKRYLNTELIGLGCHSIMEIKDYGVNRLSVEGENEGKNCKQDIIISTQGFMITGSQSAVESQNTVLSEVCEIDIQETKSFFAGDGFNLGLKIGGKLISGTGCAIFWGNTKISDTCNPRSVTIQTGGLGYVVGKIYKGGKTLECNLLLNLPSRSISHLSLSTNGEDGFKEIFLRITKQLQQRGLVFDTEYQKITPKKIYTGGVDVGIPQTYSIQSGSLQIIDLVERPDQNIQSETVTIKSNLQFGSEISGYYLVYKNKRHDLGGFWSANTTKVISKKWGFDNRSGCVYLTTLDMIYQTYCWNNGIVNEIVKTSTKEKKQTDEKYLGVTYDYTREQCNTEINLLKYAYEDYMHELQSKKLSKKQKEVSKKKKISKKKQLKGKKISKKLSKGEQELRLYRNYVSILLFIFRKYRINIDDNNELAYLNEQFTHYKNQILRGTGGMQIYTGNILQQSFKSYINPSPISQFKELMQ